MVYTNLDHQVAIMIKQVYKKKKDRKKNFRLLQYKNSKSTFLIAHYESDTTIIILFRGASTMELKIKLLSTLFFPTSQKIEKVVKRLCKKLDTLKLSEKNVIVAGHSMGGFILNECISKKDYPYSFITYAAFANSFDKRRYKENVRHHVIIEDPVSSKMIIGNARNKKKNKKHNVFLYSSNTFSFAKNHGLSFYTNKKTMNKFSIN